MPDALESSLRRLAAAVDGIERAAERRMRHDEARANGAPFPLAALARELYSAGVGRGLGEQDFAAVLEVVEGLADTRV